MCYWYTGTNKAKQLRAGGYCTYVPLRLQPMCCSTTVNVLILCNFFTGVND